MMSFCKKSGVHSVLGLQPNSAIDFLSPFDLDQPPPKYRIGLITPAAVCSGKDQIHDDRPFSKKVINDEKSSLLKLLPPPPLVPPPLACLPSALSKKDPGGIGFIDEMGGGVDGLMSCTESLGFESSDERTVDDNIELDMRMEDTAKSAETWRKVEEKRESIQQKKQKKKKKKNFPPPISSLNQDGKPNFFLRPMRKDGRLELTEVRIERPRVLHAWRQDGRLRLHLIKNDYDDDDDQDHENEEHVEEEEEEEVEEIIGEENQEKIEDWKLEEFNRNYTDHHHHHDYLHHHHHHHHHHHNLHVWRQPCVTTR